MNAIEHLKKFDILLRIIAQSQRYFEARYFEKILGMLSRMSSKIHCFLGFTSQEKKMKPL